MARQVGNESLLRQCQAAAGLRKTLQSSCWQRLLLTWKVFRAVMVPSPKLHHRSSSSAGQSGAEKGTDKESMHMGRAAKESFPGNKERQAWDGIGWDGMGGACPSISASISTSSSASIKQQVLAPAHRQAHANKCSRLHHQAVSGGTRRTRGVVSCPGERDVESMHLAPAIALMQHRPLCRQAAGGGCGDACIP